MGSTVERAEKGENRAPRRYCRDTGTSPEELQLFKPVNFLPAQSQVAFVLFASDPMLNDIKYQYSVFLSGDMKKNRAGGQK